MEDLYVPSPGGEADDVTGGRLTESEDGDLRRLNYMAKNGMLSDWSRQRMIELRARDRRQMIREPVEIVTEVAAASEKRKFFFWSRLPK